MILFHLLSLELSVESWSLLYSVWWQSLIQFTVESELSQFNDYDNDFHVHTSSFSVLGCRSDPTHQSYHNSHSNEAIHNIAISVLNMNKWCSWGINTHEHVVCCWCLCADLFFGFVINYFNDFTLHWLNSQSNASSDIFINLLLCFALAFVFHFVFHLPSINSSIITFIWMNSPKN